MTSGSFRGDGTSGLLLKSEMGEVPGRSSRNFQGSSGNSEKSRSFREARGGPDRTPDLENSRKKRLKKVPTGPRAKCQGNGRKTAEACKTAVFRMFGWRFGRGVLRSWQCRVRNSQNGAKPFFAHSQSLSLSLSIPLPSPHIPNDALAMVRFDEASDSPRNRNPPQTLAKGAQELRELVMQIFLVAAGLWALTILIGF